jgi:hypothetical protein
MEAQEDGSTASAGYDRVTPSPPTFLSSLQMFSGAFCIFIRLQPISLTLSSLVLLALSSSTQTTL